MKMAMSLVQACRSLALSTWLLSFCFVHLLCLDFTVAEKEEWYTAFVNITYAEPPQDPGAAGGGAELHTEKTECGRYGEHSPKQDARGEVVMASSAHDRLACDPNTKFAVPAHGKNWIALIPKGNCTDRDKIRNAFLQNASAVVIFNVGSHTNETITMSHAGERPGGAGEGNPRDGGGGPEPASWRRSGGVCALAKTRLRSLDLLSFAGRHFVGVTKNKGSLNWGTEGGCSV